MSQPVCHDNPAMVDMVETAVGEHIDRERDLWSPDIEAVEEIRTFLGWCANCFIQAQCLKEMATAGYTGIAGGEFLHEGVIQEPKDKT